MDKDGHVRLTDFGLSKDGMGPGELTKSFVGSPDYTAPEVRKKAFVSSAADYKRIRSFLAN